MRDQPCAHVKIKSLFFYWQWIKMLSLEAHKLLSKSLFWHIQNTCQYILSFSPVISSVWCGWCGVLMRSRRNSHSDATHFNNFWSDVRLFYCYFSLFDFWKCLKISLDNTKCFSRLDIFARGDEIRFEQVGRVKHSGTQQADEHYYNSTFDILLVND